MGVYIKGMEIPTSCGQCQFFAWSRGVGQHCAVASEITFHATIDGMGVAYERNGSCPLVPVPTHGRLKDADALFKKCEFVCTDDDVDVRAVRYSVIDAAPTIIPADESNMDSFIHIFEEDDEEDDMDSFIHFFKDDDEEDDMDSFIRIFKD